MVAGMESTYELEYHPADPSAVPHHEDFSHLLFARGYVYTEGAVPPVPNFWSETSFHNGKIRWDPRVPVARGSNNGTEVLLCGNAISTTREQDHPRDLVQTLLDARRLSRDAYLDELEDFSGQFVVFDAVHGQVRVQTDAIGSRAAFHDSTGRIVASHADIVGNACGAGPSRYLDWVVRPETYEFPGRSTAYEGVWLLMPNTELTLGTGGISRIGPRPFDPISVAKAAEEILPHLKAQVRLLLRGQRQVVVSASAGVDSRTSLAAFAEAGDAVQVFTYTKSLGSGRQAGELYRDRLAAEMSHTLGLPHRMFHLDRQDSPPPEYVETLSAASVRRSNALTSWTYHAHLPHNAVHIRAQINGVGKWHFAKRLHFTEPLELSAMRMAQLTKRGRAMRNDPDSPAWAIAEDGFQEYIDSTQLRSVPNGYRIPDLFLWEHRVGYWNHAHIVESDVTFDTHQIFGSRRIIRLMLSVPEIDRVQLMLFREIIRAFEPRLLDFKLNGKTWTEPARDLPLSAFQAGTTRAQHELETLEASLGAEAHRTAEANRLGREAETRRLILESRLEALGAALYESETRRRALEGSKLGRAQRLYWSVLARRRRRRERP